MKKNTKEINSKKIQYCNSILNTFFQDNENYIKKYNIEYIKNKDFIVIKIILNKEDYYGNLEKIIIDKNGEKYINLFIYYKEELDNGFLFNYLLNKIKDKKDFIDFIGNIYGKNYHFTYLNYNLKDLIYSCVNINKKNYIFYIKNNDELEFKFLNNNQIMLLYKNYDNYYDKNYDSCYGLKNIYIKEIIKKIISLDNINHDVDFDINLRIDKDFVLEEINKFGYILKRFYSKYQELDNYLDIHIGEKEFIFGGNDYYNISNLNDLNIFLDEIKNNIFKNNKFNNLNKIKINLIKKLIIIVNNETNLNLILNKSGNKIKKILLKNEFFFKTKSISNDSNNFIELMNLSLKLDEKDFFIKKGNDIFIGNKNHKLNDFIVFLDNLYKKDFFYFKTFMFLLSNSNDFSKNILGLFLYKYLLLKNIKKKGDNNGNKKLFEYDNKIQGDTLKNLYNNESNNGTFNLFLYKQKENILIKDNINYFNKVLKENNQYSIFIIPFFYNEEIEKVNLNKIKHFNKNKKIGKNQFILFMNMNNFKINSLYVNLASNLCRFKMNFINDDMNGIKKENIDFGSLEILNKINYIDNNKNKEIINDILGYDFYKNNFLKTINLDNYKNGDKYLLIDRKFEDRTIDKDYYNFLNENRVFEKNNFKFKNIKVEYSLYKGELNEYIKLTKNFDSCLNIFNKKNISFIFNFFSFEYIIFNILNYNKIENGYLLNTKLNSDYSFVYRQYFLCKNLILNKNVYNKGIVNNFHSYGNINVYFNDIGYLKLYKGKEFIGRSFFYIYKERGIDKNILNYFIFDKIYLKKDIIINNEDLEEVLKKSYLLIKNNYLIKNEKFNNINKLIYFKNINKYKSFIKENILKTNHNLNESDRLNRDLLIDILN